MSISRTNWRGGFPGTQVTANCLHPGFVASRFGDNFDGIVRTLFGFAKSLAAISEEEGAKTSIYLASSREVANVSGKYFDRCKAVRSSEVSYDEGVARRAVALEREDGGASLRAGSSRRDPVRPRTSR